MVDWIDFSIANKNINNLGVSNTVGNFSFLKIGPSFTYALSEKTALDFYYHLRPTYAVVALEDSFTAYEFIGVGLTHAIGLAFRYKLLNVALEPNFGSVETASNFFIQNRKMSMINTRLVVGFKF